MKRQKLLPIPELQGFITYSGQSIGSYWEYWLVPQSEDIMTVWQKNEASILKCFLHELRDEKIIFQSQKIKALDWLNRNTENWIVGIDYAFPRNHRCVMIPVAGGKPMEEKKVFTKRIRRWGLLVKPSHDGGRWNFVQHTSFYFEHEIDAYRKALEMTAPGKYIYEPVVINISVDIPESE